MNYFTRSKNSLRSTQSKLSFSQMGINVMAQKLHT